MVKQTNDYLKRELLVCNLSHGWDQEQKTQSPKVMSSSPLLQWGAIARMRTYSYNHFGQFWPIRAILGHILEAKKDFASFFVF